MRNVICTLAIGHEAKQMAEISLPLMHSYAERVGAEFCVLPATSLSECYTPHYEKLQLGNLLVDYQQAAFVDVDILVTPDAPNIFELVPCGLGATVVGSVFSNPAAESEACHIRYGVKLDMGRYFNSGVLVVGRDVIQLFDPEQAQGNGPPDLGLHDQTMLNFRFQQSGLPLVDLGSLFNFTQAWGWERRFSAHFIHYAGFKGRRIEMMRRDSATLSTALARAYRVSPFLTKLRDRLMG